MHAKRTRPADDMAAVYSKASPLSSRDGVIVDRHRRLGDLVVAGRLPKLPVPLSGCLREIEAVLEVAGYRSDRPVAKIGSPELVEAEKHDRGKLGRQSALPACRDQVGADIVRRQTKEVEKGEPHARLDPFQ